MSEDVTPYGATNDENTQRAQELRSLTTQMNWSQRATAKALEMDERTMRYYFAGDRDHPIPIGLIFALRYLLGVSKASEGALTPTDIAEANHNGGHRAVDELLQTYLAAGEDAGDVALVRTPRGTI